MNFCTNISTLELIAIQIFVSVFIILMIMPKQMQVQIFDNRNITKNNVHKENKSISSEKNGSGFFLGSFLSGLVLIFFIYFCEIFFETLTVFLTNCVYTIVNLSGMQQINKILSNFPSLFYVSQLQNFESLSLPYLNLTFITITIGIQTISLQCFLSKILYSIKGELFG